MVVAAKRRKNVKKMEGTNSLLNGGPIITKKIQNECLKKIEGVPDDKRVALVMHRNADLDSLSSCHAIGHDYLLPQGIEADIFGAGGFSHPQNAMMVNELGIEVKDEDFFKKNKEHYGLIIFCDTGKEYACLNVEPDIIIDHHTENEIPPHCLVIRRKIGSASTIVYLLLKKLGIELTSEVATALYIGISADTQDLDEKVATEVDEQAHKELRLLPQFDYRLFARIYVRPPIDRQLLKLKGRGYFRYMIFEESFALVGIGETTPGRKGYYAAIAAEVHAVPEAELVVVIGIEDGKMIRTSVINTLKSVVLNDFFQQVFLIDSEREAEVSGGTRSGLAGADILFSKREQEKWEVATEEERESWFVSEFRLYHRRIRKHLNLPEEGEE